MSETRAELLQRAYYASTAASYDEAHLEAEEHRLGLQIMLAAIRHYGFESILDVGSGTGRALVFVKNEAPGLRVMGIEPSAELRAIGHRKGLTADEGDGVAYSYSVFTDWAKIRRQCRVVHVINTDGAGINPYRTAAHVAVLGLKR
jgi:ubiquinone/menaquinone biosynthesis C-methylase UbiE